MLAQVPVNMSDKRQLVLPASLMHRFCTQLFSALAHTLSSIRLNSSLDACRYRIRVWSGILQGISCILSFLPILLHFCYFHWIHRKAVLNGGCLGGHGSLEPNVRVNIIRLLMTKFPDFASHFRWLYLLTSEEPVPTCYCTSNYTPQWQWLGSVLPVTCIVMKKGNR
jgi:hypothetical protein